MFPFNAHQLYIRVLHMHVCTHNALIMFPFNAHQLYIRDMHVHTMHQLCFLLMHTNYTYVYYTCMYTQCRMIKETMRASGANATKKHLEEVSLCALMLMNTAKKVDQMYGTTQSGSHTTRDGTGDTSKIVQYLLSEGVTNEKEGSQEALFDDPRVIGSRKVSEGRLDEYLKGDIQLEEQDTIMEVGEDEINYELYNIV